MSNRQFTTPMMQQYIKIKEQYPDCLLFFRLGDFYELFLEDASIGANVLDITLTARPRGRDGEIPMAGVPFHAADAYITKLVRAGYKVAICEQVSEPDNKGIVERAVVRIVTPGTQLAEEAVTAAENRYVLSLHADKTRIGLAFADVSTGDFQVTELPIQPDTSLEAVLHPELLRFTPTECILNRFHYDNIELLSALKNQRDVSVFYYQDWDAHASSQAKTLERHFGVETMAGFGLDDKPSAHKAAAALLGYLQYTQQGRVRHCTTITTYSPTRFVALDHSTVSNLELLESLQRRQTSGSLLSYLDRTRTAMGGRLLRSWVRQPLADVTVAEERLDGIAALVAVPKLCDQIREHFRRIGDIERIVSRLSVGLGTAIDVVKLQQALVASERAVELLRPVGMEVFAHITSRLTPELSSLSRLIEEQVEPYPSTDVKAGGIFRVGVNATLDELRSMLGGSKEWVKNLEKTERERTGIGSLKVRYNKVFGYYIEVSKSNLAAVPPEYERKQTLVNCERFITPELKDKELLILSAEERSHSLEYDLFTQLTEQILKEHEALQQLAQAIAWLDCIATFAQLAVEERLVRPTFSSDGTTRIVQGRHPVVEKALGDTLFVPNDALLNQTDHKLLVLTGPNMAGKSVYMRQVAVIVLMAHMGCFVPAQEANISPVDRVFVRSGASDSISGGLSTFMLEMVETAYILRHATKRSLVVMDEIGRGTSTYDGISIAWAVAEHLLELGAQSLFATHYHELQDLELQAPEAVRNYHLSVAEHNGEPVFLYTIQRGPASHSFGVAVARLAGVPTAVTNRAEGLLQALEGRNQVSIKDSGEGGVKQKRRKVKK